MRSLESTSPARPTCRKGILFLAAVVPLLLPLRHAAGADGPAFVKQWGEYGSGPGQFRYPLTAARAPDGTILVCDSGNNRIQRFSASGMFMDAFGQGVLDTPRGIGADLTGNAYVCDIKGRVIKFSPSGTYVREWGTIGRVGSPVNTRRLTVASDANLVLVTLESSEVACYDTAGNFVRRWGRYGGDPGEFFGPPSDVAVANGGLVYVADLGGERIQSFALNGGFANWFVCRGADGLDIGPAERVYCAANEQVWMFDAAGNYLDRWGDVTRADGLFVEATDVVVLPDGNMLVVDSYQHCMKEFAPDPTPVLETTWGQVKARFR